MRLLLVCGVIILMGSLAEAQQPPPTASLFRPPPTPPGTGFYSRTYRAPGFSPVPAPAQYNSVSFYGRSFRAPGFSSYPSPPTYGAVSFYGQSYRAPGFSPVPTPQGNLSFALVPTVAVPEGFTAATNANLTSFANMGVFSPGFSPSIVPGG